MRIEWSPTALSDLDEIFTYVARSSLRSAEALIDQIEQSVLPAAQFPYMFRAGRAEGTREILAHPNYVIIYRILSDRIRVVGVVHTSRDYPRTVRR